MYNRLTAMRNTILLSALLILFVGTTGCALNKMSGEVPVEEPDYSCAYFYFLWGRQAELSQRLNEALEAYEKALICDPDADYIIRKIPVILLRLNRGEESVSLLRKYLEDNPEDAGTRMLLARVYIGLGMYENAARQYETIHRQDPEEIGSLMLLSELYLSRNNLPAAENALQKVLVVKPDSYPAHVLLARIYLGIKQFDRALDEYDKALAISWSPDLMLEKSDVYRVQDKYGEMIPLFGEILREEPDNERVALSLVNALLHDKKEDQAEEELHRLKSHPGSSDRVDLSIARLYARMEKYNQAAAILRKYLEKDNTPEARYLLAVVLTQAEQYEQALSQLQMISPDADQYENVLTLQVRILRYLKRPEQAVELLERLFQEDQGRSPDFYVMLAALYQLQDRTDKGRETFSRALSVFPDDEELLYEYGLFLDTAGKQDEAMSVMQKVIKLKPEHGEALNYVGYSWADRSVNLKKALEYIEKAVKLKPQNGYILDSLGWVNYRLGRFEEALDALTKAVELSPKDPTIHEHLGDVYLELGRKKEALELYRQSLEFLDKGSDARKVLDEKIRLLEKQE